MKTMINHRLYRHNLWIDIATVKPVNLALEKTYKVTWIIRKP